MRRIRWSWCRWWSRTWSDRFWSQPVPPPADLTEMLQLPRFRGSRAAPAVLLGPDSEQVALPMEVYPQVADQRPPLATANHLLDFLVATGTPGFLAKEVKARQIVRFTCRD